MLYLAFWLTGVAFGAFAIAFLGALTAVASAKKQEPK